MSLLTKFSKRTVLLSVVMLTGLAGASQFALAQEPNTDLQYLQGSPGCNSRQNEEQHPTLCASLAHLYRARHGLTKGDEARQDRLNRKPDDARNDQIAAQARQKAIRSIDAAIKDTRAAILVDRK